MSLSSTPHFTCVKSQLLTKFCQLRTGKGRHNGHSAQTRPATFLNLNRRITSFQLRISYQVGYNPLITFSSFPVGVVMCDRLGWRIFRTFNLSSGWQCICACAVPHPLCTFFFQPNRSPSENQCMSSGA